MDSINDLISSLSSEDIEMLKGVASSIIGSSENKNNAYNDNSANNSSNPNNSLMSLLGSNMQNSNLNINTNSNSNSNSNNPLGLSMDDFNMILKAKNIFESMQNKSSKNADLIMALKPHLSSKSQDKADQAIKMLKLFEMLPYLKELF